MGVDLRFQAVEQIGDLVEVGDLISAASSTLCLFVLVCIELWPEERSTMPGGFHVALLSTMGIYLFIPISVSQ